MSETLEPEYPTMSMAMQQSDLIRLHRDIIDQLRAELDAKESIIDAMLEDNAELKAVLFDTEAKLKASRAGGEVQTGHYLCTKCGYSGSEEKHEGCSYYAIPFSRYTAPPVVVPNGFRLVAEKAIAKFECATRCHPNAVQTLIYEGLELAAPQQNNGGCNE